MISIIVPMYNSEQYILECLESLEKQSYKNFEVIVIDDGSKDNSYRIVEEYIKKTELKIKLITQENKGVSFARNNGIKQSLGEYICFLDSDDMYSPYYLESMHEMIKNNKAEAVICEFLEIEENEKLDSVERNKKTSINYEIYTTDEILNKFLKREVTPGVWSLLVEKKLLEQNAIEFIEGAKYSEDIEFIYKVMSRSKKIVSLREKLYFYRIRKGSVMTLVNKSRIDGFKLMKDLENYFKKYNPSFYEEYKKYGVARWVFATLWQIVGGSKNYFEFKKNINDYEVEKYMKNLISFPKLKIATLSFIFYYFPYIYYILIKIFIKIKTKREFIKNKES